MTAKFICLVLALICFVLAALSVSVPRISFRDAGFAFVTATFLI